MTRGIRNNNPLNVRISKANWVGKVSPNTDGTFEQYDTPEHGIRTGAKIIANYYHSYGLNTLAHIIQRWAPSNENDTAAYTGTVSRRVGVSPFEPYDVLNPEKLGDLIEAMIWVENGSQPYPRATIDEGVEMALA